MRSAVWAVAMTVLVALPSGWLLGGCQAAPPTSTSTSSTTARRPFRARPSTRTARRVPPGVHRRLWSTQNPKQQQPKRTPTLKNTDDGATIPNEVFNLVKGIVGAGVLSLPAGVAAFGNAPSATLPALVLIAMIGCFSAYDFALIGKVCAYTQTTSYREAWSATVGTFSCYPIPVRFVSLSLSLCDTERTSNRTKR